MVLLFPLFHFSMAILVYSRSICEHHNFCFSWPPWLGSPEECPSQKTCLSANTITDSVPTCFFVSILILCPPSPENVNMRNLPKNLLWASGWHDSHIYLDTNLGHCLGWPLNEHENSKRCQQKNGTCYIWCSNFGTFKRGQHFMVVTTNTRK